MSLRTTVRMFLAAAIVAVGAAVQAGPVIGTMSFGVLGGITMNSPSVQTATLIVTPNTLVSSGSGNFTGYASANAAQNFGSSNIYANNTSPYLTMSMPSAFGTFVPSSVNVNGTVTSTAAAYDIIGTWTPGSYFTSAGFDSNPQTAKWTFSFTQTGGPNTTVSGSATFDTQSTAVPEPASMVLAGIGLSGLAAAKLRRKKA